MQYMKQSYYYKAQLNKLWFANEIWLNLALSPRQLQLTAVCIGFGLVLGSTPSGSVPSTLAAGVPSALQREERKCTKPYSDRD